MKSIFFTFLAIAITLPLGAQKQFTRTGNISFTSDAPLEKIEAINSKATSVIDIESGAIEWAVLIKAFEFKKALMQEHFNENYMESSTYPKASFKGVIENIQDINFKKDGNYEVQINGKLTLHGVTKEVNSTATFSVDGDKISASSLLVVLVEDYNIKIPKLVKENIAKKVSIDITADYKPLER